MILCSVATRGRYYTTLPLTLQAIINQTLKVDKLVIFDDNDEPKDMRNELTYAHFFQMLDIKGIKWEWIYAQKKVSITFTKWLTLWAMNGFGVLTMMQYQSQMC